MPREMRASCFTHTPIHTACARGCLGLGSPLSRLPTSLLICSKAGLLAVGLGWEAEAGALGSHPRCAISLLSNRGQVAELRWPTEGTTVPWSCPLPRWAVEPREKSPSPTQM